MNNAFRLAVVACVFSLFYGGATAAQHSDPPGRVARLSHAEGALSFSPAGEDEWYDISRNRPLAQGDRLWADDNSRAELQVGSGAIRLDENTSIEFLALDDQFVQIQLTEGSLNVSVGRMHRGQSIEIDTPNLAYVIDQAGQYRIDADYKGQFTTIVDWEGESTVYGVNDSVVLRAGDVQRFYGTDLRDYESYDMPRPDDFDRYCLNRDRRRGSSESLRYVSDDVVGYWDLDQYGRWSPDPQYGGVWYPSDVGIGWAPYSDGRWIWQEPWGWTWVDEAPWGFAPFHYGRWAQVGGRWGWIPGPRADRAVYAPALVAFIGGGGWGVSFTPGGGLAIGWFPLGPRDVYMPSYQVSENYFTRVNVSNTIVNNTTIVNVYNDYSRADGSVGQQNYVNRDVAAAVTAVPSEVFAGAKPVRQGAVRLNPKDIDGGAMKRFAPVTPVAASVVGSGSATKPRPANASAGRPVVARTPPPASPRPFAERQRDLQKNPGQPEPRPATRPERADNPRQARVVSPRDPGRPVDPVAPRQPRNADGANAAPGARPPLDRSARPESGRPRNETADRSTPPPARDQASGGREPLQRPPREVDREQSAAPRDPNRPPRPPSRELQRDQPQNTAGSGRSPPAQSEAESQAQAQAAREARRQEQRPEPRPEPAPRDAQAQEQQRQAREQRQAQQQQQQQQQDAQAQEQQQAQQRQAREQRQAQQQQQQDSQAQEQQQAQQRQAREQQQAQQQQEQQQEQQRQAREQQQAQRQEQQRQAQMQQQQQEQQRQAQMQQQQQEQQQQQQQQQQQEQQRQAREQRQAQQQAQPPAQAEAAAQPAPEAAQRRCVTPEQIEAMRKRGVSEEEIASRERCAE